MSAQKLWSRAVWMEDKHEEEGVIPTCWIIGKRIMWPNGISAIRAMKTCMEPGEKWLSFSLVKIKHQSNNKQECEDYDYTTTADTSDCELECAVPSIGKRMPKKRKFLNFVTDDDRLQNMEETDVQISGKHQKQGSISSLPPVSQKVLPSSRHVGFELTASDLVDRSHRTSTPVPSPQSPSPPSSPDASTLLIETPISNQKEGSFRSSSKPSPLHQDSSLSQLQGTPRQRATTSLVRDLDPRSGEPAGTSRQDAFPMSEARFQRRVLYLLTDIRNSLKQMQESPRVQHPEDVPAERIIISETSTMEDFRSLEAKLVQQTYKTFVVSNIQKLGGYSYKENLKKGMSRYMTNGLMTKMNIEGHGDKLRFKGTRLCSLLVESVLKSYKGVTEDLIHNEMAKYLKNAPERCGGGGRNKE